VFPVVATLLDCYLNPLTLSCVERHLGNPLLLIIDTAPIFLGLLSYLAGRFSDQQIIAEQKAFHVIEAKEKVQRESAEMLARQNLELHELNRTFDSLIYTASHDLKTPVVNFQSLILMLKTLRERPGSEALIDDVIIRMDSAAKRFYETITDLLDISRIERQEVEQDEKIDLKEILLTTWANIKEVADAKAATIILDEISEVELFAPRRAMESVFLNLMSNAIKYAATGRNPVLKIGSKAQEGQLEIWFSDNGIGLDIEANKDKLFRMFSRFHQGHEGSGIGLYIVKRTLQRIGGDVQIQSTVGTGTTFFLTLPNQRIK
jgi:signal transduction histidine kinase